MQENIRNGGSQKTVRIPERQAAGGVQNVSDGFIMTLPEHAKGSLNLWNPAIKTAWEAKRNASRNRLYLDN